MGHTHAPYLFALSRTLVLQLLRRENKMHISSEIKAHTFLQHKRAQSSDYFLVEHVHVHYTKYALAVLTISAIFPCAIGTTLQRLTTVHACNTVGANSDKACYVTCRQQDGQVCESSEGAANCSCVKKRRSFPQW